jgi:uncharacterized protein YjbI with pentapeptide repeats
MSKIKPVIELATEIKKHTVNQELLLQFIAARDANEPIAQGSLVDYVQEKFYKGENVVVVPDLSGQNFGEQVEYEGDRTKENLAAIRDGYLDLSSIDFTGSNLKGATFTSCNLKGSSFCDSDLSGVFFDDCSMAKADMRGADISHCKFGEDATEEFLDGDDSPLKPVEASEMLERDKAERYSDMYFSSTEPLLHKYRERNDEIIYAAKEGFESDKADKLRRKDEEIAAKQEKINEAWEGVSSYQAYARLPGWLTGNKVYDDLVQEKVELDRQRKEILKLDFDKDFDKSKIAYVVDPTIAKLPLLMEEEVGVMKFDPAYVRGGSKEARDQEKQYVRLTREDAEEYISAIKQNPELTLNDFAKTKIPLDQLDTKVKIVADFSTPKAENGKEYVGTPVDLSGLDFSNAKLQEACFAEANLERCLFNGADLRRATFEGANLRGAEFKKTQAQDATFFYSDMSPSAAIDDKPKKETQIIDSNFDRAFMRGSEAVEAIVENSHFNYSNIRNGNWNQAVVSKAEFNYADMEGISLAGAKLREVTMKHALLDKAIMTNAELIKVDLTDAMMVGVKAEKLKIKESILKDVDARGINLEDAEIDKLSKLEGAKLEKALMKRITADGVDFRKVNLEQADLRLAKLREANLEGVNARFANLEGAVIEGAKAAGIDMTGAQVEKLHAAKADLTGAVMKGVKGDEADFTDALLEGANLREAKMRKAIMERVDLRKAELQGAKLAEVNLTGAKVEGATIDKSTDLHGAKIAGGEGNLQEEQIDGQVKAKPIEQVVQEHNEVHAAEQKSWLAKKFGNALKSVGKVCQKIGGIIKQPFSEKWGRIIGAVAGALIVGSIAVSAVATGGLSLVAIAGVVAGAAAVGAVAGAVAGHYGAKKITAIHLAGAAVGFVGGGPIGSGVGLVVGEGVERVAQAVTGHKASELLGGGVEAVGRGIESVGNNLGVSPEVQLRLDQRLEVERRREVLEQPVQTSLDVDRSMDRERLNQRAKQHELGLVSDVSVPPAKSSEILSPRESAIEIGAKQREKEKEKTQRVDDGNVEPKVTKKKGLERSDL